jgi:flavin-dependent dehydrogenase
MRADVVVVGGGLAGTAAAIRLVQGGRSVVLVERSAGPHHKVCGEFLSGEALGYLAALGVDVVRLGAVPIEAVDLAGVTRRLPFHAMSLTRCRLDEALLGVAAEVGVKVQRGRRVRSLQAEAGGWRAELEDGARVVAGTGFLATGKHDLLGHARPPGRQAGLVGMKMYFRLSMAQTEALRGRVELMLYPGGYGGMQPVEGGAANLCCLVDGGVLQGLGGGWDGLLRHMTEHCPVLRERLEGAEPLLEKALAIAGIPYGYVRGEEVTAAGLWALGDQAAVIPSFTGDGMSIALHSGLLAAAMQLAGADSAAYQGRLRRDLRRQVGLATAISRGLVHPMVRPVMTAGMRGFPGVMGWVARRTRVASASVVG